MQRVLHVLYTKKASDTPLIYDISLESIIETNNEDTIDQCLH